MELGGTWRGVYRYQVDDKEISIPSISFTAHVRQSLLKQLRGTIEDDPPGLPIACKLHGRVRATYVFFRKIPDQFYTLSKEGLRPVMEYVEQAFGEEVRGKPKAPHVHYHGELDRSGRRVEGVWHIPSYLLMLKDGRRHLRFQETEGTWWMERTPS